MSKGVPRTFAAKANGARLTEVACELSRLIKIPIMTSHFMTRQKVTIDFAAMNMEATLRMLGPQAYVDYVVVPEKV